MARPIIEINNNSRRNGARIPVVTSLCLVMAGWFLASAVAATPPTRIAAASSLQTVLPELVAAFTQQHPADIRPTYGSSGNFSRQILQGAPFELFFSADENYVKDLADQGLTLDQGRIYAYGRIALVVPANSQLLPEASLSGLRSALAAGHIERFAIANPEHAPYGRAAREALQQAELWNTIQPFLVRGENASQATRFALGGSSQGGIVPYSLALSPAVAGLGSVTPIPTSSHQPIGQRMVLLSGASEIARAFYAFMEGPEAARLLHIHGFETPSR